LTLNRSIYIKVGILTLPDHASGGMRDMIGYPKDSRLKSVEITSDHLSVVGKTHVSLVHTFGGRGSPLR
jgi:hypothetical protein